MKMLAPSGLNQRTKRSPECTRFSPVNGSHFAPASLYYAAICLRGSSADPFVSSSDDASELSGLCYVFYSAFVASQYRLSPDREGKQRWQREGLADKVPPAADGLRQA